MMSAEKILSVVLTVSLLELNSLLVQCRISRNVTHVVVVRATKHHPDPWQQPGDEAAGQNIQFQGRSAHEMARHERASPAHPSYLHENLFSTYEAAVRDSLKRAAQDPEAPASVSVAANSVMRRVSEGSIDLMEILRHFPHLLQEEPDHQLIETLKMVRRNSYRRGMHLQESINILLRYLTAREMEPKRVRVLARTSTDKMMGYLSRFANSV